MGLPATTDAVSIYQGDTWAQQWLVKQSGVALDFSGGTVRCEIRAGADTAVIVSPTIDRTLASTGFVTLSLTAVQTKAINSGKYSLDFEWTLAGVVRTLFLTSISIVSDITDT